MTNISIDKDVAEDSMRFMAQATLAIKRLRGQLFDAKAEAEMAQTERDQLWDACIMMGHSPDVWPRDCPGPNQPEDPCGICLRMSLMKVPLGGWYD